MKHDNFYLTFSLIIIAQMVVDNFIHMTPLLTVTTLPILIMILPIETGTIKSMVVAFITALLVDLLSDGLIGLNVFALVPVALLRKGLISLVFGSGVFAREDNISIAKQGFFRYTVGSILFLAIFLALYIIGDGAATRPIWYNLVRFVLSLVANYVVALFISVVVTSSSTSSRWS